LILAVKPAKHGGHGGRPGSSDPDAATVKRLDAFFGLNGNGDGDHDGQDLAWWLTAAR
jgi:hypothetical protein